MNLKMCLILSKVNTSNVLNTLKSKQTTHSNQTEKSLVKVVIAFYTKICVTNRYSDVPVVSLLTFRVKVLPIQCSLLPS